MPREILEELQSRGARLLTTAQMLALVTQACFQHEYFECGGSFENEWRSR